MKNPGLFQAYGIELEYVIVDRDDLSIRPIADKVLAAAAGRPTSDFVDGPITWSNELTLHVIELKTTEPAITLKGLELAFRRSLKHLSELLEHFNARLLPVGMHPFMNPRFETHLWPHENNEIYSAFHRIFDCRSHGWTNLQSMHINLPFADEEEFVRLHGAIRLILPLLPAIAANSPLVEERPTAALDNRMVHYQKNQREIPEIAGQLIPEPVRSFDEYHQRVLNPIFKALAPHDPEKILMGDWINSRGAIARFDRQTIEIRVIDTQECPSADLALADLTCAVIKTLTEQALSSNQLQLQLSISTEELKSLFDRAVNDGGAVLVTNMDYLKALGLSGRRALSLYSLWQELLAKSSIRSAMSPEHHKIASKIAYDGNLSIRLLQALAEGQSRSQIVAAYRTLADCLLADELFDPRARPLSPRPSLVRSESHSGG